MSVLDTLEDDVSRFGIEAVVVADVPARALKSVHQVYYLNRLGDQEVRPAMTRGLALNGSEWIA
jgi:hypothetical protein